jgi:catechol 2,3-dioxygenase-like lactoylglutathione lyase family enzyme
MQKILSKLLDNYEQGKLSRRELIRLLAGTAAAGAGSSFLSGSTFRGVAINHVALRVTDVRRSRDFYQKHFAMPVLHESDRDCFLGLGKNFLTLFQNQSPGLDHYCISIENFSPDAVMEELKRQGLNPRRPQGTDRIYFPDPDNLTVQVSSVDHHA